MQTTSLLASFGIATCFVSFAQAASITVSAGDVDREQSVVRFKVPVKTSPFTTLTSSDGKVLPIQMDKEGNAVYVEPGLKKGNSRTYQLGGSQNIKGVELNKEGSKLHVSVDGKPVLAYQMQASEVPSVDVPKYFSHGAYLHPVTSPAGKVVTGDYPKDHRWHRGIWLGWTDTVFEGRHPDFWNQGKEKDGKLTGSVEFDSLKDSWSGPVHGGFVGLHRFVDWTSGQPKPVLNETWTVTVYSTGGAAKPVWIFDLQSYQECSTPSALDLPKYLYGGLGVRGSGQWDAVENATLFTASVDDRIKGNATKDNWLYLGGKVDGQHAGITVFCSPENFRAPQPIRLNPKNPQICWAPSQEGDWQITPGKPYVSKYRFIITDGEPDKVMLARLWQDYAKPATVEVSLK